MSWIYRSAWRLALGIRIGYSFLCAVGLVLGLVTMALGADEPKIKEVEQRIRKRRAENLEAVRLLNEQLLKRWKEQRLVLEEEESTFGTIARGLDGVGVDARLNDLLYDLDVKLSGRRLLASADSPSRRPTQAVVIIGADKKDIPIRANRSPFEPDGVDLGATKDPKRYLVNGDGIVDFSKLFRVDKGANENGWWPMLPQRDVFSLSQRTPLSAEESARLNQLKTRIADRRRLLREISLDLQLAHSLLIELGDDRAPRPPVIGVPSGGR